MPVLHCPHGRSVSVKNMLGIMVYEHSDHKSCDLMNKFSVSVERVLANVAEAQRFTESRLTKVAIGNSHQARMKLFREMSTAHESTLADMLKLYNELMEGQDDYGEIFTVFGPVARTNMQLVTGRTDLHKYSGSPKDKTLPMFDLSASKIQHTLGSIDQRRKDANKALTDLLNSGF